VEGGSGQRGRHRLAQPPANILNAPTKLMKDIGYGKDYAYDHDAPEGFSGANYWPEGMAPKPSTALRTRLRARDR
jgi:replication-associated recombination protein RarA